MSALDLFVFNNPAVVDGFRPVSDRLSGGSSVAELATTRLGFARFSGVLVDDGGRGFASVRSPARNMRISDETSLALRLRGDGKLYQLHLRTNDVLDGISYRAHFIAPPRWGSLVVPFSAFVPTYRGRVIRRAPPLVRTRVCTLGFMIADGQQGPFTLDVAWVRALRMIH